MWGAPSTPQPRLVPRARALAGAGKSLPEEQALGEVAGCRVARQPGSSALGPLCPPSRSPARLSHATLGSVSDY